MSAIDKQVFEMCTSRAVRFTGLNDMYCGQPAVKAIYTNTFINGLYSMTTIF